MAEPYLARADQLMKHMDEAEAKVEAAQDKKEKAQEVHSCLPPGCTHACLLGAP